MASEKRLIDANALRDCFGERYDDAFMQIVTRENKDYWKGYANGINWGRTTIADAPTVDAVEVVHGRWYKAPYHPYRCSCCGEMALLDMYGESHVRSNYCPNCGAKMDGGKEDV